MVNHMEALINRLPYGESFLFVDELLAIDEHGAKGTFTFRENLDFYQHHFKDYPVTPGVILIETMAQIGLVCLGLYLVTKTEGVSFVMTHSAVDFLKPVYPNEKVTVTSEKVYFRFNKLNCNVKMENERGELVCKGQISGMLIQINE